jgi:hypothetical protein
MWILAQKTVKFRMAAKKSLNLHPCWTPAQRFIRFRVVREYKAFYGAIAQSAIPSRTTATSTALGGPAVAAF